MTVQSICCTEASNIQNRGSSGLICLILVVVWEIEVGLTADLKNGSIDNWLRLELTRVLARAGQALRLEYFPKNELFTHGLERS